MKPRAWGKNLLAHFATVQSEGFVLSGGYDAFPLVVEADACNLLRSLIRRTLRGCLWRGRFDGIFEHLRGFELLLSHRVNAMVLGRYEHSCPTITKLVN